MERYQIKTDKDNGITNCLNDWARECNKPRYILDLGSERDRSEREDCADCEGTAESGSKREYSGGR